MGNNSYGRRWNLRGFLLIILLGIIGYKVVYPVFLSDNYDPEGASIIAPSFQSQSQTEYVYITVPAPTPEPLPTYTPYPTQTPQPTPVPEIVYTSEADTAYRTWMPRILVWIVIGLCFWIVWHYYKLRVYEIELKHELEMTHIEAQVKVVEMQNTSTPDTRPVNINVTRGLGTTSYLATAFDKKIPHDKVKEFVDNVEAVGLSINQWRETMKWSQEMIGDMLDHLEAIQLLHPRSQGSAATWRRDVPKETLARMLGV